MTIQDRMAMSQRERDLLKVMAPVLEGKRTRPEAARLAGLSVRQIRRIQRRLEQQGAAALIHGLRGKPSTYCSEWTSLMSSSGANGAICRSKSSAASFSRMS